MGIAEVFESIQTHADEIKCGDRQVYEMMSKNDGVWQGDLGIQYLGQDFDTSDLTECDVPTQLVEGNTIGSNHRIEKGCFIKQAWKSGNPLVMYVLHAPKGLSVTHPTHGDIECHEPGFYAIRAQRAYADELRRAAD